MRTICLTLLLVILLGTPALADILRVPDDYDTIQGAIDSAVAGDTVELATRTYDWNTEGPGESVGLLRMKSGITLRSAAGDPDSVVIDALGQGRIMWCSSVDSFTVIEGITFTGGLAMGSTGGAINCIDSALDFVNCRFENNRTSEDGGAVYCYGDAESLSFSHCVFNGNRTSESGGALYLDIIGTALIASSTFFDNGAIDPGGSIYVAGTSNLLINNTIIANGLGGGTIGADGAASVTLSCCNLFRNKGGDWDEEIVDQLIPPNISASPRFADPVAGDFNLRICSPCYDLDSPCDPEIDYMGAYPWNPDHLYETTILVPSPTDDLTIQMAIDMACPGETVLVADGTYTWSNQGAVVTDTTMFAIDTDVHLMSESGEAGSVVIDAEERVRHFILKDVGAETLIEGFTFTGGQTPSEGGGAIIHRSGGSILLDNADPVFRNCIFTGNKAGSDNYNGAGGAVCAYNGSDPVFETCLFTGNIGGFSGGAIYALGDSKPSLIECTVFDNEIIEGYGAAFHIDTGAAINLQNTLVAFNMGGVAYSVGADPDTPNVTGCDVYGNEDGDWVGALVDLDIDPDNFNFSDDPKFINRVTPDLRLRPCSPCLAENAPGGALVGTLDLGPDPGLRVLVPSMSPTIDGGIGMACSGDTVIVAEGTYTWSDQRTGDSEGLIHLSSNVMLRSETGLADCVTIDAEGSGRILYAGADADSNMIAGFTFTGGYKNEALDAGGACKADSSSGSLSFSHCVFDNNHSHHTGGAVVAYHTTGDMAFEECHFKRNYTGGWGGAANFYAAPSVFIKCTFTDNEAGSGGGAIHQTNFVTGLYTECTLTNNRATLGSAINLARNGWVTMDNCLITDGNTSAFFYSSGDDGVEPNSSVTMNCSNVYGNPGATGNWTGLILGQAEEGNEAGNIEADPLFFDVADENYYLQPGSPCLPDSSACGQIGYYGCLAIPTLAEPVGGTPQMGAPWTVLVPITDICSGDVLLYYRLGGEQVDAYRDPIVMEVRPGGYIGTIAGDDIGVRGIEYYVVWSYEDYREYIPIDGGPAVYDAETPLIAEVAIVDLAWSDVDGAQEVPSLDYRMIGFPFDLDPGANTVNDVLVNNLGSPDPSQWRLGHWDPTISPSGAYDELGAADTLERGLGYWLIRAGTSDLDASGMSASPDTSILGQQYAIIPLINGWNQISTPFPYMIDWTKHLDPDGVIAEVIWRYDGLADGYANQDTMHPFTGYFINADVPTNLYVPYEELSSPGRSRQASPSPTDWRVPLALVADNTADRTCVVGVKPGATDQYDSRDYRKPPFPGETFLSLVSTIDVDGSPRELCGDFRATGESAGWQFSLMARGAGVCGPITLQLGCGLSLPTGYAVAVFDPLTGENIEITAESGFEMPGGIDREGVVVELVVGEADWVRTQEGEPTALPRVFSLRQNYPNPFNPSTRIVYTLPKDSDVNMVIYDIAGRRVATLVDDFMTAGVHTVYWYGKDDADRRMASGVYFYRMSADSQNWTNRMLLLK